VVEVSVLVDVAVTLVVPMYEVDVAKAVVVPVTVAAYEVYVPIEVVSDVVVSVVVERIVETTKAVDCTTVIVSVAV